jgi:hypothetical protein
MLSFARAAAAGERLQDRPPIMLRLAFAGATVTFCLVALVLFMGGKSDRFRGDAPAAAAGKLGYSRCSAEDRKGKASSLKLAGDSKMAVPSPGQGADGGAGGPSLLPHGEQLVVPPPPLCPEVVLPQGDVEFSLPAESLQKLCDSSRHSAEILGPGLSAGGQPLLYARFATARAGGAAAVGAGSYGLWLELAKTATSRYPLACVGPLAVGSIPQEALELCGPGGRHYGTLIPPGGTLKQVATPVGAGEAVWRAQYRASCHSVLDVELIDLPSFTVTASAGDSVAVSATLVGANGAWQVHAKPGSDPLLALICMLAMVLTVPDRCRH